MRRIVRSMFVASVIALSVLAPGGAVRAPAAGLWTWPVTGPILRGFDPPDSPYGSGHRGIDIGTAVGTAIEAPADGVVSFAGTVGGQLFLTIAHSPSLRSTASWLTDVLVRAGDTVAEGQVVAHTGWGHAADPLPHLHFSVRLDGVYVDPLDYLAPLDVSGLIRLAPVTSPWGTGVASGTAGAAGVQTFRMGRPWTPLAHSTPLARAPSRWHPPWPPG